ncbi:gliding motility-associated C-terminal domain-containing protein [candidate division KSB1 bacterium]
MKRLFAIIILSLLFSYPVFSQYNLLTSFTYSNVCYGDSTYFYITSTTGLDSVRWDFGDLNSGVYNTSTAFNPIHIFTDTLSFLVSLTSYSGSIVYNFTQIIVILPPPNVSIGSDTSICTGSIYTLNAGTGYTSYLWQNNTTAQTLQLTAAGTYWVEVVDSFGCINRDSVEITLDLPPFVTLGPDTSICSGDSVTFNAGSGFWSYLWQDASSDSTFTAGSVGTYWVIVENACGQANDSVDVLSILPPTNVYLGPDTSICFGDSIILNPGPGYLGYLWHDFSIQPTFTTGFAGTYWVQVADYCGVASDTIVVDFYPTSSVDLGPDTTICSDQILLLDPGPGFATYLWQNGTTNQTQSVLNAGLYWIMAQDINGCKAIDSIIVNMDVRPQIYLGETMYLCQPYIILDAGGSAESYLWQDGSDNQTFAVYTTGSYEVTISNGNCYVTDSIEIKECHVVWVPNAFTPNGDGINDCFQPVGDQLINFQMSIFNRYGQLVYESKEVTECWYGTDINNDQIAPEGVYHYIILYDGYGNVLMEQEGVLTGYVILYR